MTSLDSAQMPIRTIRRAMRDGKWNVVEQYALQARCRLAAFLRDNEGTGAFGADTGPCAEARKLMAEVVASMEKARVMAGA